MADAKYVFESRTIQRMELLLMSTLGWRMNSVTPISFFDYILRRFGLTTNLHRQFFWMCERLLLSLVAGKPRISSASLVSEFIDNTYHFLTIPLKCNSYQLTLNFVSRCEAREFSSFSCCHSYNVVC